MLLPAPLPLSCVKKIILNDSKVQKPLAIKYGLAYGPSKNFFVTTPKTLFKEPKQPKAVDNSNSKPEKDLKKPELLGEQVPCRRPDYNKVFSYGGALSLLYYQTKNGQRSTQIFNDFSADNVNPKDLNNIAPLLAFFFNRTDNLDESTQLYSQVINCIFGQGDVGEARYNVLQLLNDQEGLPPGYARECVGLANSLTHLVDRTHTDDTDTIFTKLIEHYETKEPGRSKIFLLLTMFFVRDHSETMLKYYHSIFSEEDYSLLALFFGAVNGFINTPPIIRGVQDLSTWVSFKMATYMHGGDSTPFSEPSRPFLIYDKCFKPTSTDHKLHDFYEKFSSHVDVPVDGFVKWRMTTKGKYTQEGATMEFNTRQKQTAIVDFDQLGKLMIVRTINDASELFDFNPIIYMYKKP